MLNLQRMDSIILSKYILGYINEMGLEVNHLKLQKLIYYVDAWHMVFLKEPLIDEDFEAWMHGPVVRNVWNYYKEKSILNAVIPSSEETISLENYLSEEQIQVINDVLDEYGNKTPYYLECLTHEEKPWLTARIGYAPSDRCEERISKNIMKEYYTEKLYGETETEI
ncbi:hypothetical protein CD30_13085 [Ureibacillus massiliensis 4400831 = CIP 108448 = CCUG 49529]|uniref:Antitoxin SocA-like Panacea domain-containing protein n=1 Tax=Ureibacillus massiliensis 4400831 = CIP 108448 = CCUG 49529 TaxID=1211035 RepID=A0A0A3J4T7_9BACL|nr:type II toxin-antitoxin system antitoxin SocA domain-containing protein [Ureibacillus massiliensis]KGR90178.1 hypothetical protein CD30_13085 [Ureibacillus massiliensis 4400831 = CIP 108448 = CCUG 49529]